MKADLVLVSHNSKSDLEKFLPTIRQYTRGYSLLIVDNGSEKLCKDFLKNCGEHVEFRPNFGYGSGCNYGAKCGNSEFIIFLNCDLLATENWLNDLLLPFQNSVVAVTGARLFNDQGHEYPTPLSGNAIGCCYAIRRKVFEMLGGFDENFFLFFEETDLSLRVQKAGFKVVRSEAMLIHLHPHFLPMPAELQKHYDHSEKYYKIKHNI